MWPLVTESRNHLICNPIGHRSGPRCDIGGDGSIRTQRHATGLPQQGKPILNVCGPFNARSGSRVAGSTGGSATPRIRWPTCWRATSASSTTATRPCACSSTWYSPASMSTYRSRPSSGELDAGGCRCAAGMLRGMRWFASGTCARCGVGRPRNAKRSGGEGVSDQAAPMREFCGDASASVHHAPATTSTARSGVCE